MPRIPDASQLGYSVPRARTPRFRDQSGEIVADAAGRFANTVGQVADVFQEREDKFAYAQAKSSLLQADIAARKSLENDNDWASYEKRYSESMAKARENAAGLIRGKRDRALFDMDAKLDVDRGLGEIRAFAKRKEVDWGRATLDGLLQSSRTSALEAADEPTRTSIIGAVSDALTGALEKGYISDQERVNKSQVWSTDYADAFIDLQPLDKKISILEKPEGTPAKLLAPDHRANLLKAAQNEKRILDDRAKAEAKAAQAELKQALSERIRDASAAYRMGLEFDNPPSKAEYIAAYGAEDGSKLFGEMQKEQDLSVELNAIARMSPAERDAALAKSAPRGTTGVAEQSERYRVLKSRADALNQALRADPASYVTQYSPRIQEAYNAFAQADDPETAQAYASATISEQDRLGVANPQILPKEQASAIAQSFYTKPEEGEKLAALIQTERDRWGRYWPKVASQLMQAKMPASAIAIARGMSPGPATRLAGVSSLPMDQLKTGVDEPPADVTASLERNMGEFQRSLDGVVGGESTFASMYEAAERLSYVYLRQGMKQSDATEQAYKEVIGDHYAFHELNDHVFRVPAGSDSREIADGAEAALRKVSAAELQSPIAMRSSSEYSAADDLQRAVAKRGYWVTSARGERGLALFLDGAPVLKKDGSVYELTWDELAGAAEERRQEANRNAQQKPSSPRLR